MPKHDLDMYFILIFGHQYWLFILIIKYFMSLSMSILRVSIKKSPSKKIYIKNYVKSILK